MTLPLGLVAVYGSLRGGMHNHSVLGGSELVGTTTIEGHSMYSYGGYPAIVEGGAGCVVIEVYDVTDEYVARGLDSLEGYQADHKYNFYNRKQIPTEFGDVWIYFIDNEDLSYLPLVEQGDWKEYYNEQRG